MLQHQLPHKYCGELLPALEIAPDKAEETEMKQSVIVPEIRNLTVKEALQVLKEAGLDANINAETEINTEETIVTDQLPKPGLSINEGTKIEIYV